MSAFKISFECAWHGIESWAAEMEDFALTLFILFSVMLFLIFSDFGPAFQALP